MDAKLAITPYEPSIFEGLSAESSDDEFIEVILKRLYEIQAAVRVFLNSPDYLSEERMVRITKLMIGYNLVYDFPYQKVDIYNFNSPISITTDGTIVYDSGGWLAYKAKEAAKQEKEEQRKEEGSIVAVKSAKAAEKSARYTLIAMLIGVIPTAIAVIQFIQAQNLNAEIDRLSRRLDTLAASQKQIPVQTTIVHSDSLTNQPDSLPRK